MKTAYGTIYRYRLTHEAQAEWVEVRLHIYCDESAHAVRVWGTALDTSERKLAEEAFGHRNQELEGEGQRLQTLLNTLPMGVDSFNKSS